MRDESLEHDWESTKLDNGAYWNRCKRCGYYKHPGNANQDCGEGTSLDDDFLESLNSLKIEDTFGAKFTLALLGFFFIVAVWGQFDRVWDRNVQERQAKALEIIALNTRSTAVQVNPDGTYEVRTCR
jgi:hypothetical protein